MDLKLVLFDLDGTSLTMYQMFGQRLSLTIFMAGLKFLVLY